MPPSHATMQKCHPNVLAGSPCPAGRPPHPRQALSSVFFQATPPSAVVQQWHHEGLWGVIPQPENSVSSLRPHTLLVIRMWGWGRRNALSTQTLSRTKDAWKEHVMNCLMDGAGSKLSSGGS